MSETEQKPTDPDGCCCGRGCPAVELQDAAIRSAHRVGYRLAGLRLAVALRARAGQTVTGDFAAGLADLLQRPITPAEDRELAELLEAMEGGPPDGFAEA